MGQVLLDNTLVRHPDTGASVLLAKGTEVPAWADGLVGDHLFAADQPSASDPGAGTAPSDEEPPLGGPGSSREAWAEYAQSLGVEVDDDMSRDDIVDAVHNR